jgi:serine/threonine-protein kinase haspin
MVSLNGPTRLIYAQHRDLHWGQILIKDVPTHRAKLKSINLNSGTKARDSKGVPMDDLGHGVQVTIIDLGLSRMDAGDGSGGHRVQWTPFDEEIFLGEGELRKSETG